MLMVSFIVLGLAVVAGIGLAAAYLLERARGLSLVPGVLHGLLGLVGFAALLLGLRGPPHGVRMGAGSFGLIAATFVGAALLAGAVILVGRLRRRPPSVVVVAVHATLAIAGFVILAAYVSMPP